MSKWFIRRMSGTNKNKSFPSTLGYLIPALCSALCRRTGWVWLCLDARPPGQDWIPVDPYLTFQWVTTRRRCQPRDRRHSTQIGWRKLMSSAKPRIKHKHLYKIGADPNTFIFIHLFQIVQLNLSLPTFMNIFHSGEKNVFTVESIQNTCKFSRMGPVFLEIQHSM